MANLACLHSFIDNELLLLSSLTKYVWPKAATAVASKSPLLKRLYEQNHSNYLGFVRKEYGVRNRVSIPPLPVNVSYFEFVNSLGMTLITLVLSDGVVFVSSS